MKRLIVTFIFVQLSFVSYSQTNTLLAKQLEQAYEATQKFNFHSADSALKKLQGTGKEAAAIELAKANYLWWLIISGEDSPGNRSAYVAHSDKAIKDYKNLPLTKLGDEELYVVITSYANKARIEGLGKNYLKGFGHINTCLKYIQQSFGKEKRFVYFTLTSGLYNYYMATANKNFPVLIPYLALFPDGDLKKGIELLKAASESVDIPLSTEGHYFLMKLYLDEKDYASAMWYCDWLLKKYPDNLLYNYYHFKILLDNKQKEQALEILSKIRLKEMFNLQLTDKQKHYYSGLATKDLKEYYLKEGK
jgi:hypothetical protein